MIEDVRATSSDVRDARLVVDRALFETSFDRVPFAYEHNLSGLDIFSFEALLELARKYGGNDCFVASSAASPATEFYAVPHGAYTPYEALQRLDLGGQRVLLKRPENYDPRFRSLLDTLFGRLVELRPELRGERIARLESSVLISSAAAITPFHFDPEISFFFQIAGPKVYHLFTPSTVSEPELEAFYRHGIVNIGQIDFENRDPAGEHVFALGPGRGMHQPQNSPHWVETQDARSISYVFSFETASTRSLGRTRCSNYYLRKAGLKPAPPGAHPRLDALKSSVAACLLPVRHAAGRSLRKLKAGRG
jgi:hypothetical protein